jgi:hypothetical protein
VAVNCALLDENSQHVETVSQFLAVTYVASGLYSSADAVAVMTVLLKLLHKSRGDLLFLDSESLPLASWTRLNIFWVVSTRTSAVRTNNFPVVSDFLLLAYVQVLKSHTNL